MPYLPRVSHVSPQIPEMAIRGSYEAALRKGVKYGIRATQGHFSVMKGDVIASRQIRDLRGNYEVCMGVTGSTLNVKRTYLFFRATLTKIYLIKMNHIWTQISYSSPHEAHLEKKNQRVAFVKKEKMRWNGKRSIFTETAPRKAAYSEHSIVIHSI